MYELGAGSNPSLARSATADGPVLIRRAQCCGLAERIFLCFYLVGHHKPAGRAAMTFPELTLRFAGGGCAGGPTKQPASLIFRNRNIVALCLR